MLSKNNSLESAEQYSFMFFQRSIFIIRNEYCHNYSFCKKGRWDGVILVYGVSREQELLWHMWAIRMEESPGNDVRIWSKHEHDEQQMIK